MLLREAYNRENNILCIDTNGTDLDNVFSARMPAIS